MKIRPVNTALLLASLLTLAALAQAHPPGRGMGMMNMMMGGENPGGMDMMMGQGTSGGMGMMDGPMMGRAGMMDGTMMGMDLRRILQLQDLSDEQRQKVNNRHRELQRQLVRLEEKALDARFALEDTVAGDAPDPKAVGRALQGLFDVRRQMVEATIAAHNDVRGLLMDEQRGELNDQGTGMGMDMGGMGSMSGMKGGVMPQQ